ncbi:MAG: iron-sulfur cluster assembly scaffold protein [Erythrobacter sp.]|jgi:NifU-like protein involved in Fe-S cluster formation|nr:iron-sulfur cluster assembly scaffold protein [Erythrobacter sp.]
MSARAPSAVKLYTPQILGLAASLALYPLDDRFQLRAEARSPVCGSALTIGLDLDAQGKVSRVGVQLTACAIGQASAAILASAISGAPRARIEGARAALEQWLQGAGDLPDWPGILALEPARAHPGRHGALLLPWRAASLALSAGDDAGERLSSSLPSR